MEFLTKDVLLGIFIGVITAVITYLLGQGVKGTWKLIKKSIQKYLQQRHFKNRLGVISVVDSREKDYEQIKSDIKLSDRIDTISFKGGLLLDGKFNEQSKLHTLLYSKDVQAKHFRFLLLDPSCLKHIEARNKNLRGKHLNIDEHVNQITSCVQYLDTQKNKQNNNTIEYKFFKESLKWSLLISNSIILLNFYEKEKRGAESFCYIIKKDSLLGHSFVQYFDDLWNCSQ